MTDIVERLRSAHYNTIAQHEAADAIERLRHELAELRKSQSEPVAWRWRSEMHENNKWQLTSVHPNEWGTDLLIELEPLGVIATHEK